MMGRKMKNSGIEWIEEIPEEWNVIKIKHLAEAADPNSFIDGDWIESPFITDNGIRYLTTGNIGDGTFKRQGNGYISKETFDILNCKYAYPNDLVISRLNEPYGRACILPFDNDKYVLAVDIVILRTKESKEYLCYLFQCEGHHNAVKDLAKGTTMKRISRTNLGNIALCLPSIQEQRSIASYLDSQCAEIDKVLEKTRSSIEEYKKLKQAVITQAVTKGVRGKRAMKDSGIEWIGEIPEEWTKGRIKYCYYLKGRIGWQGLKADEFIDEGPYLVTGTDFSNGRVDWSRCYHISHERYEEAPEIHVERNDLLITKDGTVGKVALIVEKPAEVSLNSHLLIMRPLKQENRNEFLFWVIQSDIFKVFCGLSQYGTVMASLSQEKINDFSFGLPSADEQLEIATYLDSKCDAIDKLIAKKEQFITELEGYKKSLIYEYVTGKKEVPV